MAEPISGALAVLVQTIPEARISWRYGAEAVFFLGVAYALIRWIGRTLRDAAGDASGRESAFLSQVVESRGSASVVAASGAVGGLPNAGRPSMASAVVHCPSCGAALTPVAHPLPFAATCERCTRHVSVRGDGPGRISVVVADSRGKERREV